MFMRVSVLVEVCCMYVYISVMCVFYICELMSSCDSISKEIVMKVNIGMILHFTRLVTEYNNKE